MKKKIEDISRENYNLRESPKKTAIQNVLFLKLI